jgi:CubicO group peptidase (beta-lactamase class C family)
MWDGETYEELAFGPPALSDPEKYLQAALRYPLRKFGEVSYSSSNYAAIDLILERETGRPLGDLLRDHVFEPYGLSRSLYRRRVAVERELGRLKHDYGLAPLRLRGLERVQLHADLVMLARLAQALSRAREQSVPLVA